VVQLSTIDWDNVRLFLELTRRGSARSAAQALGMSHSTVVRRVERLESDLGARLFDRDFTGYRPTPAGQTLLDSALKAEEAILAADRQLHGRDASLSGEITVTLPDILAHFFLMPELVTFAERYPEIELKMLISYDIFDLARREADIALRVYVNQRQPPDDLIGRKLETVWSCYYASEAYLEKHDPYEADSTARWIGWGDDEPYPEWVRNSPFPNIPAYGYLNNAMLQAKAVECGLGLGTLPCFVGDALPDVVRIPGCAPFSTYELWMLTHPDLRDTARHRVFRDFIADLFARRRDKLGGVPE
jgi:DNA-binding transcriptional LysR family regulator